MKTHVISASAGSGKTWRLADEVVRSLGGTDLPEGLVAVTYTKRAAAELESRIREALLEKGQAELANRVRDGYIGTIHAVCQRLLREFAFEAGHSPWLEPIAESQRQRLFQEALSHVLVGQEDGLMEAARRLSLPDWQEELGKVVDRARENGMGPAELRASAERSQEGLARFLPPPSIGGTDYQKRLERVLPDLRKELRREAERKPSGTAKDRVAAADQLVAMMRRDGVPPWVEQIAFAKLLRVKFLAPIAGPLLDLVDHHQDCELFQEDLFRIQSGVFALAADALASFDTVKRGARVVDYGDMLAATKDLLTIPSVRQALSERLDLVVVDEFQDVSPLQLAVILALAEIAKRSVWVGDRKQAIYAFQGADPDLMAAAMDHALEGGEPEILSDSWRSRPGLVRLNSGLFTRAFQPHGFPERQVALEPRRIDGSAIESQPAVEVWDWQAQRVKIDGKNVSAREAIAVANGVEALLSEAPLVCDKGPPGQPDPSRPLRRSDVAVLARSNARCQEIASALRQRGIPALVKLGGLSATAEALMIRAALALVADERDGVAALEFCWLSGGAGDDPDGWLGRMLVAAGAPDRPLPFDDDPQVRLLREMGSKARDLSPAEALDLVLREVGIAEKLAAWPEARQRLANIEAVRAEALAYQDLCHARSTPATLLGLVGHLSTLKDGEDDADGQALPGTEDAVTVSTWHGAKGLEWRVVVLSHLDHDRERSVFDVAVEPASVFDASSPLAGRWIRWWPWPYGDHSAGLALADAARQSAEGQETLQREQRERLRLLYVGFTRPRDLLVLVAGTTGAGNVGDSMLGLLADSAGNRLLQVPFLPGSPETEVVGAGMSLPCKRRSLSGMPASASVVPPVPARWYAAAVAPERPRERLNPSVEPWTAGEPRVVGISPLAGRVPLQPGSDMQAVGKALHAFLAADSREPGAPRLAMATRLADQFGVAGSLSPSSMMVAADALWRWIEGRWPGATIRREWPLRARVDVGGHERLLVGEVDLFLELPEGFVLLDHKSFPGDGTERDRRLLEFAPQLAWYARTLQAALGKRLLGAFIHLPVRGEVAEMELRKT